MTSLHRFLAGMAALTFAMTSAAPAGATVLIENYQAASIAQGSEGTKIFAYGSGTEHLFDNDVTFASGVLEGDAVADGDTVTLHDTPLDWWDEGWVRRQCIDLTASDTLARYPFRVIVDTSGATAENVRVVEHVLPAAPAVALPHYVESGFGTTQTVVWFQAPASSSARRYCVYFAHDTAISTSDDIAPFTYDSGQSVSYYTMLDSYTGTGVNSEVTVISYSDGNVVSSGGNSTTLSTGQTATFTGLTAQSVITATGPIEASSSRASKEALIPEGFADAQFSFPTSRYVERFWVRSPHEDTVIEVLVNGVVQQSVVVTPALGAVEITQQAGGGNAYVSLRSTDGADFLAVHSSTTDQDIGIGVPWFGDTLFGVGSTVLRLGTTSALNVSWRDSDGSSGTQAVTTATLASNTGNGSYGSGPAHAITGSSYFAAWQQADSNGTEVTTFLPERLLSQTYRLPVAASRYVTVACPVPGTLVTLNGVAQTCSGTGVGHTFFGYGTYAAGTLITADHPIYVYYETASDEHNIFGPKAAIPYLEAHSYSTIPVEDLGEPCGSWTSPNIAASGIFGLSFLELVGASAQSFEMSFDGGAFGPVGNFIDYAFDESSTAVVRVSLCGQGALLHSVGFESELIEVATGEFSTSIVDVTGDAPVMRVYPSLSMSWIEGIQPVGSPSFDIEVDLGGTQVSVVAGTVTNLSPIFPSTPYTVSFANVVAPQSSTIEMLVFDEGSSVRSVATVSLAISSL